MTTENATSGWIEYSSRATRTYTAISTIGNRWEVLGFGPTKAEARQMAEAAIDSRETGIYAETLNKNLTVVSKTTAADRFHALNRTDLLLRCPDHGAYVVDAYGQAGDECPTCEQFAASEEA